MINKILLLLLLLLLLSIWMVFASSGTLGQDFYSDIDCLRAIKDSLEDPFGYLSATWNFNNNTEGFICKFTGVDCWHPDGNKVLNIRLSDMGLKGQFPTGIRNCTSITGLDLSNNKLSGPIPENIGNIVSYLTSLDLSSNEFSGPIPAHLANLSYLSALNLDHNRLSGSIPEEMANLHRIKTFNVANNLLSGPVPRFTNATIPPENYANNPGLCGPPLDRCVGGSGGGWRTDSGSFVAAHIAGGTVVAVGFCVVVLLYFLRKRDQRNGATYA